MPLMSKLLPADMMLASENCYWLLLGRAPPGACPLHAECVMMGGMGLPHGHITFDAEPGRLTPDHLCCFVIFFTSMLSI